MPSLMGKPYLTGPMRTAIRYSTSSSGSAFGTSAGIGQMSGACAMAWILQRGVDAADQTIVVHGEPNNACWELGLDSSNRAYINRQTTAVNGTTTITAADGWVFVMVTRASGTTTPRFHIFKYRSQAWAHEDASGTLANITPNVGAGTLIGARAGGGFRGFTGDFACGIAWAKTFTDAATERLARSYTAIAESGPVWFVTFNWSDRIHLDLSGKGGHAGTTGTPLAITAPPLTFERPTVIV